jgi:hypothetical protein
VKAGMKPWPRRVPLFSKPKASCDFIRSERIVGLTEPDKSGSVVFPVLATASPKLINRHSPWQTPL